jgi:hypothetical protein
MDDAAMVLVALHDGGSIAFLASAYLPTSPRCGWCCGTNSRRYLTCRPRTRVDDVAVDDSGDATNAPAGGGLSLRPVCIESVGDQDAGAED